MKLLVAGLCLAALPAFSQGSKVESQLDSAMRQEVLNQMQRYLSQGVVDLRGEKYPAVLRGDSVITNGPLIRLSGAVEIRTDSVIVHADQAVYHADTGEFEPTGNVRITRVPK
jgi:lipopolysaccharide assembly outer membrane protein LptD (OstA)